MRGNKLFKIIDKYVGAMLLFTLSRIFSRKIALTSVKYQAERILLIKLSAMGDTILMVPAIRALRQKHPQALIKIIVTSINRDILQDCPYVNETIFLDLERYSRNPFKFFGFIRKLRQERFDLAIDFDQWLRFSPLLSFASGAEQRIGFKTAGQHRHYLYTRKVEHARDKHEVECFLDLVRVLGIEPADNRLELWTRRSAVINVNKKLAEAGLGKESLLIGIHPGCGAHGLSRQWPEPKFVALVNELQKQEKVRIILTGGRSELELVERIAAAVGIRPFTAVGWELAEIIALIKKYKMLVCGNTGVMHIAAAVQIPVVALHGPTDPVKWGPWGENNTVIKAHRDCSPCLYLGFEYACREGNCMDSIEVAEVYQAAQKYL